MSFGGSILELWKRAPAWRFSIFGAVIASILAVMTSGGGGGGAPAPTPVSGGGPAANQAASSPGQTQKPQSCGPQGQASVSAPIVVSATGQVPANVTMQQGTQAQPGGTAAAVQSRFVQFVTRVDAAAREGRRGESCVKMAGSMELLEPTDYAYADCFADGPAKLVRAQQCASDLAASEARFDRLASAYKSVEQDRSGPLLEQLSRSRDAMTDFDKSREKWQTVAAMERAGDEAASEIAASNARIADLERAASRAGASPGPQQLEHLAAAGRLTALDRARLTLAQQDMLARAAAAAETLSESDRRFAELASAASSGPQPDAEARAALIRAVSQLTGFDTARATAEQTAQIDAARQTAASFAMDDLMRGVQDFIPSTAPPSEYARLRDLRALLMRQGGVDSPTEQQAEALRIAQSAETALAQSDRRIARMREVVAQVEQGGPRELGDVVVQAHGDITAFDIARMQPEDQRILARLEAARDVTLATEKRLLTRDVPIFLNTNREDAWLAYAIELLDDTLRAASFNIVAAQEQSAVTFDLTRSEIDLKEVRFSGSSMRSAEVTLTLTGSWTVAGDSLQVPAAMGDAVSGTPDSLSREALSEAVDGLVDSLAALAERD